MKTLLVAGLAALGLAAPLRGQQPPPLKHVSLSHDGSAWVALGGQGRLRGEAWRNFGFGSALDPDDAFLLNRALANADLHLGTNLRLFAEAKSAVLTNRSLPGGRRPIDADDLDLQQAYLELAFPVGTGALAGRVGRQELLFGKQRLVSPLDWSNTRRSFEGVRATLGRP